MHIINEDDIERVEDFQNIARENEEISQVGEALGEDLDFDDGNEGTRLVAHQYIFHH